MNKNSANNKSRKILAASSSLKSIPRRQEKGMSFELANCRISRFRVIFLCLAAALLGGACSGKGKEATVEISPEIYKINSIKSKLATPVVDEAIKLNPSKVTVSACSTTQNHPIRKRIFSQIKSRINSDGFARRSRHRIEVCRCFL
jgi:hypothetical protein